MSFVDLLRNARRSRASIVHQFLTNYDPNTSRVYGFVEGEPDRIFYKLHIERFKTNGADIFIYNCDGKSNVYAAYSDIVARYPHCERVLFFVDKDVDDILGRQWPTDPRIFVTRCYSIENYLISGDALKRYFTDFVKVRRLEITLDSAVGLLTEHLDQFHKRILPMMAWIIVVRRGGETINLSNIDLTMFFEVTDTGIRKKACGGRLRQLCRMTQTQHSKQIWRQVRATCVELRRLPPRSYVRGKFEAWWFIQEAMRIFDALRIVAKEAGGSIAVSVALSQGNFIQILTPYAPPPEELATFLEFHIGRRQTELSSKESDRIDSSIVGVLKRLFH